MAGVRRVHRTKRDEFSQNDNFKQHSEDEIDQCKRKSCVNLHKKKSKQGFSYRYILRVYEQGNIGSCTANALCSAYSFHRCFNNFNKGTTYPDRYNMDPSCLFVYYNSRVNKYADTGVSIRDSLKAFHKFGVCCESQWHYTRGNLYTKPTDESYAAAANNKGCTYKRLLEHHSKRRVKQDDIHQLKTCLHQKSPFIFSFDVHENFHNLLKHSIMPHPSGKLEGGHAVLAVGYNDNYHGGCVCDCPE